MVTDRFDGALARSYGMVTEFGKLADPIADKALIGAALIGLSLLGDLWWWVTVVILVREIGVTVLRFAVLRRGVIPASRGGKLKTLVQAVAIGLFILPLPGVWHTVAMVIMAVAIVLTVVTGIDYVVQADQGVPVDDPLVSDREPSDPRPTLPLGSIALCVLARPPTRRSAPWQRCCAR